MVTLHNNTQAFWLEVIPCKFHIALQVSKCMNPCKWDIDLVTRKLSNDLEIILLPFILSKMFCKLFSLLTSQCELVNCFEPIWIFQTIILYLNICLRQFHLVDEHPLCQRLSLSKIGMLQKKHWTPLLSPYGTLSQNPHLLINITMCYIQ